MKKNRSTISQSTVNSCSRKSNMKFALFLGLCLAFAFVVESFEEEAVSEDLQGKESFEEEKALEDEQGKESFGEEKALDDEQGKESFEEEKVLEDEQGKESFKDEAVSEDEQGNDKRFWLRRCREDDDCAANQCCFKFHHRWRGWCKTKRGEGRLCRPNSKCFFRCQDHLECQGNFFRTCRLRPIVPTPTEEPGSGDIDSQ